MLNDFAHYGTMRSMFDEYHVFKVLCPPRGSNRLCFLVKICTVPITATFTALNSVSREETVAKEAVIVPYDFRNDDRERCVVR